MATTESPERLTEKEYWDDNYSSVQLPRLYSTKQFTINRFHQLFTSLNITGKSILEVGCGASAWLPFFKEKFGADVYGLDYSENGCDLAKKNLQMFGISDVDRRIFQVDILSELNVLKIGRFDVVFSYGVVEHFVQPDLIINRMLKYLKPDGVMITVVPNLNGFYRIIGRSLLRDIYNKHVVFTKESLSKVHEINCLKIECSTYFGSFFLGRIAWSKCKHPILENKIARKLLLRTVYILNKGIEMILRKLDVVAETMIFSPYIVCIAKLKTSPDPGKENTLER